MPTTLHANPRAPRRVRLLLAGVLAMLVLIAGGCDWDDDEYYLSDRGLSTSVQFEHHCAATGPIDIYVDGSYRCTVTYSGNDKCTLQLDDGSHVYWAESESLLWGDPYQPISFYLGYGDLEIIRLTCD